ncbi:MAG: EFR1 family ferrodoxin [Oscillospiraceae bacterium]
MIFYFSGTGNSQWVAEELGLRLGEPTTDLRDLPRDRPTSYRFGPGATVGLVFPVYAWAPPEPVMQFVRGLPTGGAYTFAVCTCGEACGNALKLLSKRLPLDSAFSLVMPNNYLVGSEVDSAEQAAQKIAAARQRIPAICEKIKARERCVEAEPGKLAFLKSAIASRAFNAVARQTKPFRAGDGCIGCGLCAANCPARTIRLTDGRPQWGARCYQCLSCINRCPQEAIQYGAATEGKARYYFGKR